MKKTTLNRGEWGFQKSFLRFHQPLKKKHLQFGVHLSSVGPKEFGEFWPDLVSGWGGFTIRSIRHSIVLATKKAVEKQPGFLHEIMPKKTGVEGKEVAEGKKTPF